MKGLISLAVVLAFFVAVPQCLGQSQDTEQLPAQLLEEQQLVQMFQLAMMQGPPGGFRQNSTLVCHQSRRAKNPGQGFTLTVNNGKTLKRHCDHGDCTVFPPPDADTMCTCPADPAARTCEAP